MMFQKIVASLVTFCAFNCFAQDAEPVWDPKVASFVGVHPGRFAGKVCFITGATSGLGEHAAYHLAQEGCAIAVTGRREDRGEKVVDHINNLTGISTLSPPAIFIKVDVTVEASLHDAVEIIENTWGRLDAVFANAGSNKLTFIEGDPKTVEKFKWIMDLNVIGVFSTIVASTPLLKEKGGGQIVLCSSIYGLVATPVFTGYIASKHALEGIKKAAASELYPQGIRVNNLAPSFTPSELTSGFAVMPAFKEGVIHQMQPDKSMSHLAHTSSAAAYLLSSDSEYINGHTIPVDAGMINYPINPLDFMAKFKEAIAATVEVADATVEVADATVEAAKEEL